MRNADEVLVLRKKQQDVNNSQSAVHQRSGDDTVAVASVAQPTESQSSVTTSSKNQINISQPVTQIEMCTINEHTQHNMGMIGSNNVSTPPSLINTQTFNQSGYEENQSYNQYENLQVTSAESHSAFNHVMPQNSSLSNFSNDGDVSWNMSCGGFYHSTPSRPDPWATPCTSINTSDVMGSAYGSLYGQPRNSQCHSSCSCCGTVAALLRRVEMLEQAEEARRKWKIRPDCNQRREDIMAGDSSTLQEKKETIACYCFLARLFGA
ncbi:uncharacterized protein LOC128558679 [Mercenaria mercenaria]|uniref:uncharacterized protein LOC128558679 n=1 Tax=Mercenaria mercenaria TaxID=6596 RepID=UPI00234F9D9C|nr:uncharacterized protein LOC128558679 [Mercenaria mercenaria]